MRAENLLMVADSENNADMLYAVGLVVPDPFIYLRHGNQTSLVMSDLEIERARHRAPHCRVLSLSQLARELRKQQINSPSLARIIQLLLRSHRIRHLTVPSGFPHGLAVELNRLGIRVRPRKGPFFPEREIKTSTEVKKISAALTMAEVGLAEGIQVLRSAKIGKRGQLFYRDLPLTADKLRSIMEVAVLHAGGQACRTIVASGKQACDPHEPGYGPLRAHQPIVIDIFPRSQKTGYYGDITRTVVKGRASEAVRRIFHTVACAQKLAMQQLRPKTAAVDIHRAVQHFFDCQGFKTGESNGRMTGFFHATGHGLGLDIHESPRLSATSSSILRAGNVVTVEPGLYYPEIGGIRLEDVALVTPQHPRNLTQFEKVLEI
jgi:Xaa-Pro aminopeptidase